LPRTPYDNNRSTGQVTGERRAYAAAQLFDGESIQPEDAVIVEDGRVAALVRRNAVPEGIPVYDAPDCTLLPGLIDAHVHFMRWQGPLFLAYGVTTVRDCGNDPAWILARRAEWPANPWPRILCLGPIIDGPQPIHPLVSRSCASADEAAGTIAEMAAAGLDGIKLYVGIPLAWLPQLNRAAHARGLKVSMHCSESVLSAGFAGIDEFYHLDGLLGHLWPGHPAGWLALWGDPAFAQTWDAQLYAADAISQLGLTATPTLAYWDSQWRVRTAEHRVSGELGLVPGEIIATQAAEPIDPALSAQWKRALQAAQLFVGLLAARGVPILAGTDVPCGAILPGLGLWHELALLVEAGLTPSQALKAATSGAADYMGHPELGRLKPGTVADMVFVGGDPTRLIPLVPEITAVVRGGVLVQSQELMTQAEIQPNTLAEEPWARQFAWHTGR
jgi:hypothetical protein